MLPIFRIIPERKALGTPIPQVHSFEHVNNQKQELHNTEITQTSETKLILAPLWNAGLLHKSVYMAVAQ
jgi:hypothetical protein